MSETLFKQVNYTVGSPTKLIVIGTLSLPDIAERSLRVRCRQERQSNA